MRRRGLRLSVLSSAMCIAFAAGVALAAMELPDKLKEVPVYSNSKIKQTMDMGTTAMASLEVKAKPDAILEFYKQNLTGKGWKVFSQMQQENESMIQFHNGKQMLHLQVQSEEDSDTTTYNLVMYVQQ